jgi:hypothetical protein
MLKYTVHFVDRMSQSLPVGNRLKSALKKAVEYVPRNVYEAYVREETDGEVTAQWSLDYATRQFVPFSARAECERRIEAAYAQLRKRRELLPAIDAVMNALRGVGVRDAQCEPNKQHNADNAEWRWFREGGDLCIVASVTDSSLVRWELRTWDHRPFSTAKTDGVLPYEGGKVELTAELIAAIQNSKRCF